MNRKKLIIGLIFTSFLSLSSLKANLLGELIQLVGALTDLEIKLVETPLPLPPRDDETPCPIIVQRPRLQRTQSASLPKTPLSQSDQRPAAKPKPQPSLAQTTPPGGIPVAQRRADLEKEPERPATPRRSRPQSARFERPLAEPAKKTVNWVNLKNSIQQLESLPSTGPEQTTFKKSEAKATLDAIGQLVEKTRLGDLRNKKPQLWDAIRPILAIDPLLIQSAINILRKGYLNSSEASPELYTLMTDLYENRISFLEKEFKKIKPGFTLAKGIRDDIDEGLTYPIEISGEVQDAQIKATKNDLLAGNFFNTTNDQWERLLLLLRSLSEQQKDALRKEGIDIDQYINNIEENKLRTYCRVNKPSECKDYISFYDELNTMAQNADDFKNNKLRYNRSSKTFAIQNIINKLNAFAIYAQDTSICQICLNEDAQKANEEKTEKDFNRIESLFTNLLLTEPNNNTYNEALKTIALIKNDEAVRRSKVRRLGAGYQYQD